MQMEVTSSKQASSCSVHEVAIHACGFAGVAKPCFGLPSITFDALSTSFHAG